MGLKIPLSGSPNSLEWVSKFPPLGLKNPPRKGIRNRRTAHARRVRRPPLDGSQTVEKKSDLNSTV